MPDLEPTSGDPLERLRAAERGRRRLVVQGVSAAFAGLTGLAVLLILVLPAAGASLPVNLFAAVGFVVAFGMARRRGDPTPATVVLLAVMQLQHLGSALWLDDPARMGSTIIFSALLPLIAGATLSVRGVLWWTALPTLSTLLVIASGLSQGFSATTLAEYLAAPLFFVIVAGTIGALTALAEARSMAAQERREEHIQRLAGELEAARRMDALGRLAGGVAHDFNNMLSVIGSCASMVRAQLPEEHGARRDLVLIDDAVARSAELTAQLLAFARHQVTPPGQAAPGPTVARVAPLLKRALGTNIALTLDTDDSHWQTAVDGGRLEQVVTNLVLNARDAMPEGGTLSIRVLDAQLAEGDVAQLPAGDYVVVEVKDSGAGIDPEAQARIFEPFFTTKGNGKGTGLGLSTCYGIARQAGGILTAESEPGAGASFRLYLPRVVNALGGLDGLDGQAPAAAPAQASVDGMRVLIVDDERAVREALGELLQMRGAITTTASNLAEALAAAEAGSFDAIVSDVVLGSDDGLDALERIRQLQPDATLIAMSGYTPAPGRLTALRDTGIGFLAKPFTEQQLLDALRV